MVRFTCKSSASLVAESTRQTRSMTRRQQKAIPPVFTEDAVKPVKTNPRSKKSSNKRATTQRRAAKLQSAVRAGKQTVVKSKAKKRRAGPSFVYVGNLQAGVHEQRLHSVFSKYGEISKISIRCSGGQVITIGTPIPSSARGSKDILYAAIEFYDSDAGRKSFEADGYILDGEPLVVTSCAANLPELKAILKSRGAQPKAQVVSKMAQRWHGYQRFTFSQLPTHPTQASSLSNGEWNQHRLTVNWQTVKPFDSYSRLASSSVHAMSKTAALNPASLPFFPGLKTGDDDDGNNGLGYGHHTRDLHSMSSVSTLSGYRSAKSSPSPSLKGHEVHREQSPASVRSGRSPTFRQVDASKPYPTIEPKNVREASMLAVMGTLPENEDVLTFSNADGKPGTPSSRSSYHPQQHDARNQSPPVSTIGQGGPTAWATSSLKSTSPASSLDSASQFMTSFDPQTFESQLNASPFISDLLERLVRCETSTRQIQTDLSAVHRKVNFLVDAALAKAQQQPEFQDPFTNNVIPTNGLGHMGSHASVSHRPSIGNIAPNQLGPGDEISHVVNHLNALTTSVGQLLALQTTIPAPSAFNAGRKSASGLTLSTMEIPPHQVLPPSTSNSAFLGNGLPNRPDLRPTSRQPNTPMRTWSAGTLDLPMRNSEPNTARPDNLTGGKRRSVANLMRRDSSGILEGGEGPIISKWEQLALSPELLRSLNKFGMGPPNKIQQRALPFLLRGSDIIAQAPPTQERIAAYVIPAIQVVVTNLHTPNRGPLVIMVSTTVDQATQAQRMIRNIGGPIGVRSALGVGTTNILSDLTAELRLLQQNMPHIICGTPQKLHALFTSSSGLQGNDVRFLVLDEVDQLIARNLHDFVFNIVKLLPPPRRAPGATGGSATPVAATAPTFTSPFEPQGSIRSLGTPLSNQPTLTSPFETQNNGRRPSFVPSPAPNEVPPQAVERQTALFSNTVPQDVLNLASAINLREPVRVLVRRDGNVSSTEPTQGSRGLRQFYLYLAFTASGRSDSASSGSGGLGIIGSGRGVVNAETAQAREWKLDALIDLFDECDTNQAIVHVGSMAALDSVVYKLASRGAEAIPLHGEMNAGTKLAALNKFRAPGPSIMSRPTTKVLVVYDVQVKNPEVPHVPLVINYDLPKAVEEYSQRVVPAIASNYSRAGVVINFVTATGGDVEMLRSIECFYKIKCPEVPASLRDIL